MTTMWYHRIDGFTPLDPASIAAHAAAGERVIVQFGRGGYMDEQLAELNRLAKQHGRGLEIRFYGHYGEVFDGAVLRCLPDAMCVSIDCLSHARNLDALSHIENLQELRLGIFELDDAEVLAHCNPAPMKMLSLGETRKRNIDLGNLARFRALESLHSIGETKNIAAICDLPLLRDLSLSSFRRKDDIGFVSHLAQVVSLRLILGGRASIAALAAPALENLEIVRVQGLEDLGDLARFERLRHLKVEVETPEDFMMGKYDTAVLTASELPPPIRGRSGPRRARSSRRSRPSVPTTTRTTWPRRKPPRWRAPRPSSTTARTPSPPALRTWGQCSRR